MFSGSLGRMNTLVRRPLLPPTNDTEQRSWHRAIAAHVLAGKTEDPSKIAKAAWPDDARAQLILRAGVTQTTTADFPTFDPVAAYRSLAPSSAALALFQLGMALDLTGATTIRIPGVAKDVPYVFVEEGKPAPSVKFNFDTDTVLGPVRKILLLSAVTEELEYSNPNNASAVIGRVLSDVANRGIDAVAFGSAAADVAQPAGLLHGVTPITAAAAGPDAMTQDLGALVGTIGAAGIDPSNTVFVAGPRQAMIMKAKVGSKFDHQVLMTLGLPAKTVAAFAPAGVASGYQSAPVIETSKHPAWHLEDTTPLDISDGATVAAPVKSAFQAALISIKVRANCAWAVTAGAAQVVEDVNW